MVRSITGQISMEPAELWLLTLTQLIMVVGPPSLSLSASVVLWAAGCAASCCPPAHTDSVGRRLCSVEAGASVPELGEQSELGARLRQPAGPTHVAHTHPETIASLNPVTFIYCLLSNFSPCRSCFPLWMFWACLN